MRAFGEGGSMVGQAPPAFFRRGLAPLTRFVFFVGAAIGLLVADIRFHYLEVLRQAVSVVTFPLQEAAFTPARVARQGGEYFSDVRVLQAELSALKAKEVSQAGALLKAQDVEAENARLRALLDLRQQEKTRGVVAEVVATLRDPFSRKVFIDKGLQHNVAAGQVVVDEAGVIGQVVRAYPFSSEVALITGKGLSVPVQVARSGFRGVVFGAGDGTLEMRFVTANADVEKGDVLVTSGIDEIYMPGLPVARVASVTRDPAYAYARIVCTPVSVSEQDRHVLVLATRAPGARLPAEATAPGPGPAAGKGKSGKRPRAR